MAKINLTAEQRAAILAGSSEIDLGEAPPASGAATPPATPPAAVVPSVPAAAAAAAAPAAPAATTPPADAGVVAFLTGQLADKDKALLAANVEIATLKAASADAEACLPGLLAIAQGVIGQMQVALGNTDSSAALNAKDALAAHATILPVFKSKFPVGGIASTATEDAAASTAIHPLFAERLAANRFAAK